MLLCHVCESQLKPGGLHQLFIAASSPPDMGQEAIKQERASPGVPPASLGSCLRGGDMES